MKIDFPTTMGFSTILIIGIFFTITAVVYVMLPSQNTNDSSYAETVIDLTYEDISNFDKEKLINEIREGLLNEPNLQNKKFDYLESIRFNKHTRNVNVVGIVFPLVFPQDSEELQVIMKTLNELCLRCIQFY